MNVRDVVILLAVLSGIIGAVLSIRRNRKAGKGCCGNCSACGEHCGNKKAGA